MQGRVEYDDEGRVSVNGKTTQPLTMRMAFAGVGSDFIAFDYMVLPDGQVALHAQKHLDDGDDTADFEYFTVDKGDACGELSDMMNRAIHYLYQCGYPVVVNETPKLILEKLAHELAYGYH